jgi:soluble lytic murein transglycosylase
MLEQDKSIKERKLSFLESNSFFRGLTGGLISILLLSGLLVYLNSRSSWQERKNIREETLPVTKCKQAQPFKGGVPCTNSLFYDDSDRSLAQKLSQLRQIAAQDTSLKVTKIDRDRARYLLAVEYLKQNQPQVTLKYLEGLAKDYQLLAPYIMLREAQAYQKIGQNERATTIAQSIWQNYPDSPVIADVITLFGRFQSQDREYLLTHFPYHPQTQQLAKQHLKQNPDSWQSLLLMVTYDREKALNQIRDRLVLDYPEKLTKANWQAIADGYWRAEEHRKAADAYLLSPPSPQNLYRTARGFHRNGNFEEAKRAYQKLIREYHDAQETGAALIYLARLSSADEAIAYLERAIAKFPDYVPQALLNKAVIYEAFDKEEAAKLARQQALENHADSAAVLNYRWQKASRLALQGDYNRAWQWGKAIAETKSPESDPKTIFWAGKWAKAAKNPVAAERAFKNVIALHPQSYYAWRAAVMLGWNVGDFNRLRQIQPNLSFKLPYEPLPVGSEIVQELYLLGQDRDAWIELQGELTNPQQLTVEEQFTEGLLLVKMGQTSTGVQSIWNLAQRESPLEQQQWRSLRNQETYWYSLFPFPNQKSIIANAREAEINPLLTISVIRKESTFDPTIGSRVGAVGLMQIIPSTADWIAEQNKITEYELTKPEDNIRMGTWYLAHNHERYNNNSLYAIASYNAGTGNVSNWLEQFSQEDPDLFVEQIPFPETKDYVEGVFGNYWNYLRLYDLNDRSGAK